MGSIWPLSMFDISQFTKYNFFLLHTWWLFLIKWGELGKHKINMMICSQCPVHILYAPVFFGVNLTPGCFNCVKYITNIQFFSQIVTILDNRNCFSFQNVMNSNNMYLEIRLSHETTKMTSLSILGQSVRSYGFLHFSPKSRNRYSGLYKGVGWGFCFIWMAI